MVFLTKLITKHFQSFLLCQPFTFYFRDELLFDFMNEKYISLYLCLLFTFVTTIITTYLQYNVIGYESNCHNRILMNRNGIKNQIQFKSKLCDRYQFFIWLTLNITDKNNRIFRLFLI